MSNSENVICKFCGEEKVLINAHIIPKCFFKPLRSYQPGEKPPTIYSLKNRRVRKQSQSGIYDKNLVCGDCDQIFGSYEAYANDIFIKKFEELVQSPPERSEKFFILQNIDFNKIRLFVLSILWKASNTRDKCFSQVRLGDKFEQKLKHAILNGGSNDFLCFPIMIRQFQEEFLEKLHVEPMKLRLFDLNAYRFCLGRFSFDVIVDSQNLTRSLDTQQMFLGLTDTLCIFRPKVEDDPHFAPIAEYFRIQNPD